MSIDEFVSFNSRCIVCKTKNQLWMHSTIREIVDTSIIYSLHNFREASNRKQFLTFARSETMIMPTVSNIQFDIETLDTDKYLSFVLHNNNIITFDKEFQFKMKISFIMICPLGHYSYSSRFIRLSNKSPDITKGYSVELEELRCEQYRISSNIQKQTTHIYNYDGDVSEPTIIPYKAIASFPFSDKDKCLKKIQNILLLA